MSMRRTIAATLAFAAAMSTAHAADETGAWYVNPNAGYMWGDRDRAVDDDLQYGVGLGRHISPNWSLELNGSAGSFDAEVGGGELDITAISLDALRVFNRPGAVSPFLSFGAGYIEDDFQIDAESSVLAQVAGGLLIDLVDAGSFVLQLRPELRARWDFIDQPQEDRFVDLIAGVGLSFAFGATPAPVAPPAPPPAPPAPVDSDNDGVFDPQDRCPNTPRGIAVDANGCPRKGSVTLTGVNFETNSATLTADSRPALDKVAADLKKYPRLKVELQGHTDNTGADQYNRALSQRRAESVRTYLLEQGVNATQLTATGYGESQPVADNTTAEGRAENRRVAMDVLDNPGDVEVKEAP